MPEWVVFWSLLAASVGVSVGLAWDGSRAAHRFGGVPAAGGAGVGAVCLGGVSVGSWWRWLDC